MNIHIDKSKKNPLYWQISDQIKEMILSGRLADGSILPSERTLANILQVHRNTVIKAYGVLKDLELIVSVQGVGHMVSYSKINDKNIGKTSEESFDGELWGTSDESVYKKNKPKGVNWKHSIRDEYQDMDKTFDNIFLRLSEGNHISFSSGMPSNVYSKDYIEEQVSAILNEAGYKPCYITHYQGDLGLRQQILSYLRTKGIKVGLSQIQVLTETNQALDFLAMALLKEEDYVIVEEPLSPDVYRILELAGCRIITVPIDDDGIICQNLEPIIERYNPKMIYVNSSFHDPTGAKLSIDRRKELMRLSEKYGIAVVEEDAASELSFDGIGVPTIKSMDKLGNVIYIYSFALTFIPGFSIAFVVGPEELMRTLSYLVSIRIMSLDWLTQKLIAKSLRDGTYYRNVKDMVLANERKMNIMCDYLDRLKSIGLEYKRPKGGVYIWCSLPEGVRAKELVNLAMQKGVAIFPGYVFYPKRNRGRHQIRLNFSYETEDRIHAGMIILSNLIENIVYTNKDR